MKTDRICGSTDTTSGDPCRRRPPEGETYCYLHSDPTPEQSALWDALTSLEPGDAYAGMLGVVCGIYFAHDPSAYEAIAELLLPIIAGGSLAARAAKAKGADDVAERIPAWQTLRYMDAFVLMAALGFGAVVASHGDIPFLDFLHGFGLFP